MSLKLKGGFQPITGALKVGDNYVAPDMVTTGLLLHLDAGDPASYSGSGSTWFDISGNNRNFTLENSPSFSDGAFAFNGSNQRANIADGGHWNVNHWTQSAWVKTVGTPESAFLSNYGGGTTQHYGLRITNGQPNAYYDDNGAFGFSIAYSSAGAIPSGEWHHLTASWSRGNFLRIYVDGVMTNENTSVYDGMLFPAAPLYIGYDASSTGLWYTGSIAVVNMHNVALTDAEIYQNYEHDKGRFQ